MRGRKNSAVWLSAVICAVAAGLALAAQVPPQHHAIWSHLRYRFIGPVGNRSDAVAGVAGDPMVYYLGAASGGVWKSSDGGDHWTPVFDREPAQSIGALAVAPSDPNVVWAGTGESFIRSHISIGDGMYKSTDAGRTWTHEGLENTGRIARVIIDPRDPDIVFACALGTSYGPQPERGVFRTADGGKTWSRVLFVDEKTGCSDLAMDPNNPRILFAGMWQVEIHTWGRASGGPGSGIFRSQDNGITWTRLEGNGLPHAPLGRIGVGVAPSNSNRVYALIETGDGLPLNGKPTQSGQLWRSDDGGRNWELVSSDRQLRGRTHYYDRTAVEPDNENEVYFLSAAFSHSLDGGRTLVPTSFFQGPGGDNHDMWIDPKDGNRMIVANDGGAGITVNRGRTWNRVQLPIAQIYHVTVDNQIPYFVYGNKQDGESYRGPSNSLAFGFRGRPGAISRSEWESVGGGESGFATPDPVDNNIVWSSGTGSGSIGGTVTWMDLRNRQVHEVEVWPESTIGAAAADVKYRFNWEFPLLISLHDHHRVYVGSQFVHVSNDGGHSWQVISPDLTLHDRTKMQSSGGLTPDNIGVEYAGVVFSLAESPKQAGVLWAGTNDGLVHVTRDGGKTWTNVTSSIPNLPPWGTVSSIEASHFDAGTAYITVDFHQENNRAPYVYKTTDFGRSWASITQGVPPSPFSYAHIIREDPGRRGLLFLGTENGAYVSFNDGGMWQSLQMNLPHAPVYGMAIQEPFHDLVLATYGRGFWILDDLTPLEDVTPKAQAARACLFPPRDAYRFRSITEPAGVPNDPTAGENPPYGAGINYLLKSAPTRDVKITISDASGHVVREFQGTKEVGINRVWWDLRYEPTREIRLRTSPPYAPDVTVGPQGWRPIPGGHRVSLLALPGTYTVKLEAGGETLTQKLTVLEDPHSTATEADLAEEAKLAGAIAGDVDVVAGEINQLESVRAQLANLDGLLGNDQNAHQIRQASDALAAKLAEIEEKLFQMKVTGRGQDDVRWPAMLLEKLTYLAGEVQGSDMAPTTQQAAVAAELHGQASKSTAEVREAMAKDLAAFNALLRQHGVANVIAPVP